MQLFIAQQEVSPTRQQNTTNYTTPFFTGVGVTIVGGCAIAYINHWLTKRREKGNKVETKIEQGEAAIMENNILKAILASEERTKAELKSEISSVKTELNLKIDTLKSDLKEEIANSEKRIYNKIDVFERVRERVAVLESKVS
jgi:hypothetical protein